LHGHNHLKNYFGRLSYRCSSSCPASTRLNCLRAIPATYYPLTGLANKPRLKNFFLTIVMICVGKAFFERRSCGATCHVASRCEPAIGPIALQNCLRNSRNSVFSIDLGPGFETPENRVSRDLAKRST
jgi:hypothetical protein